MSPAAVTVVICVGILGLVAMAVLTVVVELRQPGYHAPDEPTGRTEDRPSVVVVVLPASATAQPVWTAPAALPTAPVWSGPVAGIAAGEGR